MIKKIFLSLLLVISFLFISGFTTFAESETIAQVQEFPNATIKAEYDGVTQFIENANTYEYRVVYTISDVYSIIGLDENEYFMITYHYITWRKGINRSTNSYELIDVHPAIGGGDTRINIRVTLLKSFVNDNYPDDISLFFRDYSALYIIYNIGTGSPDYNAGYNAGYNTGYSDGYNEGYQNGRDDGYNDGYDVGYNYGHRSGYESGHHDGYFDGVREGYDVGYDVGYNVGYDEGKNDGYNEGYNEGYNDGYNDFNVTDYFGDRNIAKDPDIHYSAYSDPLEPTISKVIFNKGYNYPNTLLDKPYLIVIIKKNIYDYVTVLFDDYARFYHYEARHYDIGDYDIYVFNFSVRLNEKYRIEIIKENVTTGEEAMKFFNDVVDNLYFSHASKLLTSFMASQFYYLGYITGLEEMLEDNEAYQIGFENGYDRGYNEGHEDGYDKGFEDGYDQGFDYGKTVEYEHGYKDGYKQGSNDAFLNDVAKWFGPMVLIVLIAGAYVTARNRRSED